LRSCLALNLNPAGEPLPRRLLSRRKFAFPGPVLIPAHARGPWGVHPLVPRVWPGGKNSPAANSGKTTSPSALRPRIRRGRTRFSASGRKSGATAAARTAKDSQDPPRPPPPPAVRWPTAFFSLFLRTRRASKRDQGVSRRPARVVLAKGDPSQPASMYIQLGTVAALSGSRPRHARPKRRFVAMGPGSRRFCGAREPPLFAPPSGCGMGTAGGWSRARESLSAEAGDVCGLLHDEPDFFFPIGSRFHALTANTIPHRRGPGSGISCFQFSRRETARAPPALLGPRYGREDRRKQKTPATSSPLPGMEASRK